MSDNKLKRSNLRILTIHKYKTTCQWIICLRWSGFCPKWTILINQDIWRIKTWPFVFYVVIMPRTSFRVNLHSTVCLNVNELLARSRPHIWSLNDSNVIRDHNHLIRKRTLIHLAKLAKWLGCFMSTYLYGAFDCVIVMSHTSFRVNLRDSSS